MDETEGFLLLATEPERDAYVQGYAAAVVRVEKSSNASWWNGYSAAAQDAMEATTKQGPCHRPLTRPRPLAGQRARS